MAYSTPALVRKALVPSSDGTQPATPTHTAADLTDAQLADAIAEADALIDSMIGRFYAVPVDITQSVPHPIDFWSRNIAAYTATLSYRGSQEFSDNDPIARRYTATMQALQAVANGNAGLQIPVQTNDQTGAGAASPINPYIGTLFCVDDFDLAPPGWPSGPQPYWPGR